MQERLEQKKEREAGGFRRRLGNAAVSKHLLFLNPVPTQRKFDSLNAAGQEL